MAMDFEKDDQLLRRLRRLLASAAPDAGPEQRRLLLLMQSEMQAVRAELIRRSRALADQIDAAGVQFGAAGAYARCAKLRRGSSKVSNQAMD